MFEDRLLLKRLKRGDREAFRLIYEKYGGDLFTLAAHLLHDPATTEDVLQDVFVSLVRSVHRLNLRGSLKAYLMTAVVNRARDHYRRQAGRQVSSIDEVGPLVCRDKEPVQMVISDEQMQRVRAAIATLPYEQREAVTLRLHADMKFREIAGHQNVSIKTALSRYQYGLDKLRVILNGEVQRESS